MEELKLRRAFGRVRSDMEVITSRLEELQSVATLNQDIKEDIKRIRNLRVDKFVEDMQKEFRTIELLVDKFNDKFNETSTLMKSFSNKIDEYKKEVDLMKKEQAVFSPSRKEVETMIDKKVSEGQRSQPNVQATLNDFSELVNEKVDLELSSIRAEMTQEIAKLYDKSYEEITALKKEIDSLKKKSKK